ncbi:MAG: hypothetical protein WC470_00655 [Candidatus Paceibacterota bacterium]
MCYWQVTTLGIEAKRAYVKEELLKQVYLEEKLGYTFFVGLTGIPFKKGDIAFIEGLEFFMADSPAQVLDKFLTLTNGLIIDEPTDTWRKFFLHPLRPIFKIPWCEYLTQHPIDGSLLCENERHCSEDGSGNLGNCIMVEAWEEDIEDCPICKMRNLYKKEGEKVFCAKIICREGKNYKVLSLTEYE